MPLRWDLDKRAVGAVLGFAAVMKGLGVGPLAGAGARGWLTVLAAGVELVIGAGLLFRVRPSATDPAATLLLVTLGGASWVGMTRGVARCGCFGPLGIPPAAAFAFDAAATARLVRGLVNSGWWSGRWGTRFRVACVGCALLGLAAGAALYPHLGRVTRDLSPEAVAAASTVIVEPAELEGRPFPLRDHVRIGADLSRGDWKVILARPGCQRCARRLRSGECRPEAGRQRVAVVLAGHDPGWELPPECQAVVGSLDRGKTWLFEAPLVLRLVDGRVTEVR